MLFYPIVAIFTTPEIRQKEDLDIKSDLWSLGRLIYTLLFTSLTQSNPYLFECKNFICILYEKLKFLRNFRNKRKYQ